MISTASRRDKGKGEVKPESEGSLDDCYMTRVIENSQAERPAALIPSAHSASCQSSRHPGGGPAKASWEHLKEGEEDCVILGEGRNPKKARPGEAMIDEDASLAWALAIEEEETRRGRSHPLSSTGPRITPSVFNESRIVEDARLAAALAAEEEAAMRRGSLPSSSGGPGNSLGVLDEARLADDARLAAALAAEEEAEAQRGVSLPSSSAGSRHPPGAFDKASVADDALLAAALAAEEEEQERGRQEFESAAHQAAHESEEFPDLVSLFLYYNDLYFEGALLHCIVQWSSARMTLCAGVCCFDGALCTIRLSEPLLKYRPLKDMKETLLHEMIHAFIFLKLPGHTHEDHGPMFCGIMERINQSTVADHMRPPGGYKIGVYHTFHDEVDHYRKHHWTCDRCGRMVRRAMNRPPSLADCFSRRMKRAANGIEAPCTHPRCLWHRHIQTCGGAFVKTAEPEKPARGKGRGGEQKAGKGPVPGTGPGQGSPSQASIADLFRRRAEALGQKREPESPPGVKAELEGQVGNGKSDESVGNGKSDESVKGRGGGKRETQGRTRGKTQGTRKDGGVQVKIEGEEKSKSKRQRKKGTQEQSGAGGEESGVRGSGPQGGSGDGNGQRREGICLVKEEGGCEGQHGRGGLSASETFDISDPGNGELQIGDFGDEWSKWKDDKEFRLMQERILASCQAAAATAVRK